MADDVVRQSIPCGVVKYLTDQCARLAPVVVFGMVDVGAADDLAVGGPLRLRLTRERRCGTTFRVRRIDRVGHRIDTHRTVFGVRVDIVARRVDRDLLVVHAEPGTVRVGIGEHAAEQHAVGAESDTGYDVVRLERRLLDLGMIVGRVGVQRHLPDLVQRVVTMRPHLGQVKGIEPIRDGVVVRHQLHLERPARSTSARDVLEEVAGVEIGVGRSHLVGFVLGEELDALIGDEVIPHPVLDALGIHPQIGVRAVAVHVAPGLGDTAVAHQPGDLMRRLRRQRPEVPLHVVVAKVVVGAAFLRPDEVLELQRILDEEDRRVVADHVVDAL
ncbi:Uncharacterised protein [Mycobacteroides abscessus subsp. abscessus]|nr:Uncharacterised protein [Mycobacteroides abscessus subsp. abscessus]